MRAANENINKAGWGKNMKDEFKKLLRFYKKHPVNAIVDLLGLVAASTLVYGVVAGILIWHK